VNRDRVLLVLPFAMSVVVFGALVVSMGTALAAPGASDIGNVVSGTERFTLNLENEVLRGAQDLSS
jgi:hypothetical protein